MRIQKNRFYIVGFIFASLIICMVFSNIEVFSYLSLTCYICYWLYLYHFDKIFFVKYLAFIFSALATVAGTSVIELLPETYLPELRCQSHFSGSLPLLIFSYWVFLFVLEIKDYRYKHNLKFELNPSIDIKTKKTINLLSAATCILFLIVFIYTATHSSMMLSDRFAFSRTFEMPWIIQRAGSLSSLMLIFPLLALIYGNRPLGITAVVLYFLQNLWTGSKFGAFFSLLCILLMVFYKRILSIQPKRLNKTLKRVVIAALVLIIFASFLQSSVSHMNIYDYFSERMAQQGQLWWRMYDLHHGEVHPSEFINDIYAFFEGDKPINECIGAQNGIYKAMYLCAPAAVISGKLSRGSRYTEGAYPIVYYYFGAFGVIVFSVLMGIIVSSIVNIFINSLHNREYIRAMIYLRFFNLIRLSFSMFIFAKFLDLVSIFSYLYLIFETLYCSRRHKEKFQKSKGYLKPTLLEE